MRITLVSALCAGVLSTAPIDRAQLKTRADSAAADPSDTVQANHAQLPISSESYVIAARDLLYINVFDVPELSRDYRVSADGEIGIPLLNMPVPAAGKTLQELSAQVSSILQKNNLVNNPRVTILLEESPRNTVTVTGSVSRPGVFPLDRNTHVLEAITAAGGANESAGDNVQVGSASKPSRSVSLKQVLSGNADANLELHPGDTVSIETAPVVYVAGAVNHPGAFPVRDQSNQMTVLRAIALAEDAKSTAALTRARIIHRDTQVPPHQTEIPINVKKIVSGHAPDQILSANDILFVPESSGKKAALRGAEAAVQTATGIAIFGRY